MNTDRWITGSYIFFCLFFEYEKIWKKSTCKYVFTGIPHLNRPWQIEPLIKTCSVWFIPRFWSFTRTYAQWSYSSFPKTKTGCFFTDTHRKSCIKSVSYKYLVKNSLTKIKQRILMRLSQYLTRLEIYLTCIYLIRKFLFFLFIFSRTLIT